MTVLVVTGTDTGIGKTVATAALAAAYGRAGGAVAVCKPVQTGAGPVLGGSPEDDDDLLEIARLTGVGELIPGWRYPEPMAPLAAATRAEMALPARAELRALVDGATRPDRLLLIEGAGGLLVELGAGGATLRDLAADLGAPVLVVAGAGLGTLNHTALTVAALDAANVACAGVMIGSWPAHPSVVEVDNRAALARIAPLRAVLPQGAARLDRPAFAAMAADAFDPAWVSGLG